MTNFLMINSGLEEVEKHRCRLVVEVTSWEGEVMCSSMVVVERCNGMVV